MEDDQRQPSLSAAATRLVGSGGVVGTAMRDRGARRLMARQTRHIVQLYMA